MKIFLVHKKQSWEKVHAYSLVDKSALSTVNPALIHKTKEVEDKLYTKEQLEALRDSLV